MKEKQLWLNIPASAWRFTVLLGICVCFQNVWANGFRNPPEGAVASGRVGKTALVEDASAIAHNPANVALLQAKDYVGSVAIADTETEYRSLDGVRQGKTTTDTAFLPALFFTSPATVKGKDVSFGFGVTSPWGQSTEWSENGPFAFVGLHFAELLTIAFTPMTAFHISDNVLFGVGVDLAYSNLSLDQQFAWGSVTGNPATPPGLMGVEGDGFGAGARLGLTWLVNERQRFAFTARTPMEIDYEGDATVTSIPPPGALPGPLGAMVTPKSGFETEIDFPTVLAVSYGSKPSERMRFGVDFEWVGFSSFDRLPLDLGRNSVLLPFDSVPQGWRDTITIGFGGDYDVSDTLTLRAGYVWLESPVPPETLAPTIPDTHRHILNVGFGYEYKKHKFDVAYGISFYDDLIVSENVNPAYNGEYDIDSHLLQLTYNYRF